MASKRNMYVKFIRNDTDESTNKLVIRITDTSHWKSYNIPSSFLLKYTK